MKQFNFTILLIGIFLLSLLQADGQTKIITRHNTIKKSYKVKSTDTLAIINEYGNVTVKTWKRPQVAITITESGKANTAAKAQTRLNNINILEHTSRTGKIVLTTEISTPYNSDNVVKLLPAPGYNNYEVNIQYVMCVPEKINLDIKNNHGDVILGDFRGPLNINLGYGCLHAKNIKGDNKKICIDASWHAGDKDSNTIYSIERGEIINARGGKLIITKPIDTSNVKLVGWDHAIVAGKTW